MAMILVVEDDLHILRVVSMWLKRNGHQVVETRTGHEGLDRLRIRGIDLMVADVNMPGMTGVELLEVATREGLLPHGAIILTSRCDQHEIANAVKSFGGTVHPKPFSPSRLIQTIEEKLAVSAAQ